MKFPLLGLLCLFATVTVSFGQTPFAAPTVFSITENYSEVIKGVVSDGNTTYSAVPTGGVAISVTIPLAGFDVAAFDTSTPVSIQAGNFIFNASLGDDPTYVKGKTSV